MIMMMMMMMMMQGMQKTDGWEKTKLVCIETEGANCLAAARYSISVSISIAINIISIAINIIIIIIIAINITIIFFARKAGGPVKLPAITSIATSLGALQVNFFCSLMFAVFYI